LAIELVTRFHSPRIHKEVRWLLLNAPAKAIAYPEALHVLLDGTVPGDVSFQLKVSLIWGNRLMRGFMLTLGRSTSFSGHRSIR